MARAVTALYNDYQTAERVVDDLERAGFARQDISIVANDASGDYQSRLVVHDNDVKGGEGASFGALTGAAIGLGAMLIPGVGPVIAGGPLIAGLVGAGIGAATGAVTGGITASLIKFGFSEEEAGYYAEGVRRGGTLVVVHAEDSRVPQVKMVLDRYNAVDITTRATNWRESGWTGFDVAGEPYTSDEVEAERRRYDNHN